MVITVPGDGLCAVGIAEASRGLVEAPALAMIFACLLSTPGHNRLSTRLVFTYKDAFFFARGRVPHKRNNVYISMDLLRSRRFV